MTRGKLGQRRRQNLLKEDPYCWYCGIPVVWFETNGSPLPPDFATLEHLFTRVSGRPRQGVIVLACHACNHARGLWDLCLMRASTEPSQGRP